MFIPNAVPVYNDNQACVNLPHSETTKGFRHLQIRENFVRESQVSDFADICHIAGDLNLSDIFTKEDRNKVHFYAL